MAEQNLREFIQQMRKNNGEMVFPLLRENQFHSIYTRSYNIDSKEKDSFNASMEEELSFVSLIDKICFLLEHEDIPRDKELAEYIRNLNKIFSGYATEGNYAGRYFTKILSFFDGFLAVIKLNIQRDEELLAQLHSVLSGKPVKSNSLDFYSENAEFYTDYKMRYTGKLQEYYDIFHDFLQKETDKRQGLKVTTRTEQCLLTLTGMIEHLLYHSQSVSKLLNRYKRKLQLAEKQIQYN